MSDSQASRQRNERLSHSAQIRAQGFGLVPVRIVLVDGAEHAFATPVEHVRVDLRRLHAAMSQ